MAKKPEVTSKRVASKASKVLTNPKSSKAAKSAAGSTLSQTKSPAKVTSKKAASAASKTLRDPKATKAEKSAAASALTQAPDKKQ
ncbi:hypothetical protein N9J88_02460 [Porticoccaceae bacterium]|nr:hypothetical protein [Porticoccaceae bacterium]